MGSLVLFCHKIDTSNTLKLLPTAITAVRTNVANLSDAAMWKIRRARFARNQQKSVRSLRDSVKGTQSETKRAFSLPETLGNRLREYKYILMCPLEQICQITVIAHSAVRFPSLIPLVFLNFVLALIFSLCCLF